MHDARHGKKFIQKNLEIISNRKRQSNVSYSSYIPNANSDRNAFELFFLFEPVVLAVLPRNLTPKDNANILFKFLFLYYI